MIRALVNGVVADQLPLSDRAIHYGDGVFETIAVRHGRFEFWQRHMVRLSDGCTRLGLPLPECERLLSEARSLMAAGDGVIKIIISRGAGGRGYRPPASDATEATRMVIAYPLPDVPLSNTAEGAVLRYCTTPATLNPALAGIKHLNRLEQVLARAEWSDPAIAEGLMCDMAGHLIEGTMSNLFFVRAGVLHTPDLSNAGVAGIIRGVVIELAKRLNIPVRCQHYTHHELLSSDEIFITNSVIGLWPVRQVGENMYGIGGVTRQLLDALDGKRQQKGEYEIV